MKVLVTGHRGYLGSVLTPVLQEAGHEVVGLDSGLYDDALLGPAPQEVPTLDLDLRDVTARSLEGLDAIVHLAALSNDPLSALDPALTHDINHHAASRLAVRAKQAGVRRFLYASTCSVYGASGGVDLVGEDTPLAPLTPYAVSKVRVEADLTTLADDRFSPVSLRNATAFGYSPRLRADIVLNNLVGWAVLTGRVRVLSDGTPVRPLVHVQDIAQAFLAALTAPRSAVHGRALNVGDERNNATVAEIAEAVVRTVPAATLEITGETGGDPRSYRVDFSAIREALPGWRARWSIEDGAAELADAYRRFGLDLDDFEHRFVRLALLQQGLDTGRLDDRLRVR